MVTSLKKEKQTTENLTVLIVEVDSKEKRDYSLWFHCLMKLCIVFVNEKLQIKCLLLINVQFISS